MEEVRKNSREYFVNNGTQTQKNAIKNLKPAYDRNQLENQNLFFDNDMLLGTKEEIKNRFSSIRSNSSEAILQKNMVQKAGGIENLIKILDENGDNIVTQEEIDAMASVDTPEFDEADKSLSLKDLGIVYKNVTSSENAVLNEGTFKDLYYYKDGSITQIIRDENRDIIAKFEQQPKKKNNEIEAKQYNYNNKSTSDVIYDSQGRKRYVKYDAPGKNNDKVTKTKYYGNSKTEIVETAGRYIVSEYDKDGKRISKNQTLKYEINGEIEDTKQKSIGECWVLSGVNALRTTESGKEIIKNSIKQNPNGTVTVTLKGVDRQYTFTPEEIGGMDYTTLGLEYAQGDADMTAIEMAITKYRQEIIPEDETLRVGNLICATPENPIDGGHIDETISYLTGKTHKRGFTENKITTILNQKASKPEENALCAQFKEADSTVQGIISDHAYSVNKVDDDFVYVVNPHDSSKEIKYPKDKFLANCYYVSITNLK